ncbi:MAG: phosphotransferase [Gammaproteobacteria bacterium]|nr:phosphotransferase [Gammaproteobacteria bacterium]
MSETGNALDTARLAAYLEAHVPGFRGPLSAEKFAGGQSNPTYLVEAASGRYVLRRKPPGELLKSAHAVDREFRVLEALHGGSVPVAKPYHLCTDDGVIGSWFYLMDHVDGRIFWNPALPELDRAQRGALYDEMNRVLAALHAVDVAAVGLADYGKPGNYFERQVGRWTKQYRASETERIEAMERLMAWLPDATPADDGRVGLIHGDYRLDNLIFAHDRPAILAVVDWELSTLGHPFADLAYQCMQLRLPGDLEVLAGLGGLDRAALGIPSEADYVAAYCARAGLDGIPDWDYYLAFSFFRFSAILQGIRKRALDGNASSKLAHDYGALARPLAEMGWAVVEEAG